MSKPDLLALQYQVSTANRLIREIGGSTIGFSLIVDRETGVLEDVEIYPFAGINPSVGTTN
jgi:hypothetical protein